MHSALLQNTLSFILLLIASASFAQEPLTTDKAISINEFSHEPYRRTFAMPLPLDNAQTLYFERDGTQAKLWRLNWRNNSAKPSLLARLPVTDNDKELRYTALQTRVGLWLIGPVVMVIKTDGSVVSLPAFGANEPTAVALSDGSVFVLGSNMHNHTETLRRLALTAQGITVEAKGELPNYLTGKNVNYKARYGVAALTLADGRVFTAGGGFSDDLKRAAIVNPQNGSVQILPDMPHKRTFAALLSLKDGRVVVAGHDTSLTCSNADERTVDIYTPQLNTWQSLPDLPFPLCANAYYATGPTGTVLPNGTIVLGGNLEQHVMVLRPDSASANGYAHFWEVVGPTDRMRIGGVLQALSNSEVVIAGGVHHLNSDGCCYGTPGAERLKLIMNGKREQFTSVNISLHGAGIAQHGDRVFIASGRVISTTHSGQLRYSTVAELLDLRTGRVQQLPSLPFVTGEAQVAWLDEDHVLVKGQFADRANREFQPGENLSSYISASSGALAIFDVSKQQWSKPFDTEQLQDARLLDAHGDEALLLNSKGSILQVRLSTQLVNVVATPAEKHTDATGRLLADGRVVVAGGNMHRTRISLINDTCELATANPTKDCPEQYVGWGALLLPAVRYQWYTPQVNAGTSPWRQSENAPDANVENMELVQTIVDTQGRVLRLVRTNEENKSPPDWWLMSSHNGSHWQRLPMPNPDVCAQGCRLKLAADPRHPQVELLFLREGEFDNVYFTLRLDHDKYHTKANKPSAPLHVWWLDESASSLQWQKVLQTDEGSIIRQPQALTGALSGIQSFGWNLAQPILWMSH